MGHNKYLIEDLTPKCVFSNDFHRLLLMLSSWRTSRNQRLVSSQSLFHRRKCHRFYHVLTLFFLLKFMLFHGMSDKRDIILVAFFGDKSDVRFHPNTYFYNIVRRPDSVRKTCSLFRSFVASLGFLEAFPVSLQERETNRSQTFCMCSYQHCLPNQRLCL